MNIPIYKHICRMKVKMKSGKEVEERDGGVVTGRSMSGNDTSHVEQ